MSNRGLSNKHVLPANPTWIEFERSDGDQNLWPRNTTKVVDQESHVNYMRVAPLDDYISIKWRVEVGKALAGFMDLPGKSRVLLTYLAPRGFSLLVSKLYHNPFDRGARLRS